MEIKSALWQKLFIVPIALLLCAAGIGCLVLPFNPSLSTPRGAPIVAPGPADFLLALVLGLFMLALGFGVGWPVFHYSIRADETGISQTNGFFYQSVRWADVASYYLAMNPRHHSERRLLIEPVLLGADGTLVFQGFAHILVSTRGIVEQRRQLWRFVEAHLEGKKIDAPAPKMTSAMLAQKSLEVDWSKKSLAWKIGRIAALTLYALFWLGASLGPFYYYAVIRAVRPPEWVGALIFPMIWGPLLPHLIWLEWKKRRIEKTMESE